MRQVKLIPSGCQYWNRHTIAWSGADTVAFCSTLSIYILELASNTIQHIISGHEQNISWIIYDPSNPNRLATTSSENVLFLWDIMREQIEMKINLQFSVLQMEWNPFDPDEILLLIAGGDIKVLNLQQQTMNLVASCGGHQPRFVRWHLSHVGRFLIGCITGMTVSVVPGAKINQKILHPKKLGVEDAQWDPLSDNYVLIAYSDGSMILADIESETILQSFEQQGTGIKSIVWNKAVPGGFFTCNEKIAQIRVWNVSNKSTADIIKIGSAGFKHMVVLSDRNKLFCSFTNGSVGIVDLNKKKLEFQTEPGHAETIFDIKFCPRNRDILATCGYDGTIKIWDVLNSKNVETLHSDALVAGQYRGSMEEKCILYGLAWSSHSDSVLATCSARGTVLVFDYKKAKLLCRFQPSIASPIHRICWNPSQYLAVGTADCLLVIMAFEGDKIVPQFEIKHPKIVYGVAWNPHIPNQIATGCTDSILRIYSPSGENIQPQCELRAHNGKIFNVSWHPLIHNIIASSSDDQTVIVWNVEQRQPMMYLRGHTSYTRPIEWNYEIPWLLMSGSWDSTARLWDVRTGECIHVTEEHHADIYGISSHPKRPFMYVSCSRDTSLRFWTLEFYITPIIMRCLLGGWSSVLGTPEAAMEPSAGMWLTGRISHEIAGNTTGQTTDVMKYNSILTFFQCHPGEKDFFDLLGYHLHGEQFDPENSIAPLEEISSSYKSLAEDLQTASSFAYLGTGLARKEDRLREAAKIHLKTGNIHQYCEIMVQLGNWERALAFAPAHCPDYWQELTDRYAEHLQRAQNEETGTFLISGKKINDAIQFFLKRGEGEDALVLSSVKSAGLFPENQPGKPAEINKSTVTEGEMATLKQIVNKYSMPKFNSWEPILSAAIHVSIKDFNSAYVKLIRSHEIYYAFVLAQLVGLPQKEVRNLLALRAETYELDDLVAQFLVNEPGYLELFHARKSVEDVEAFYVSKNMFSRQQQAARANEHLASGLIKDAIQGFIKARDAENACRYALQYARDSLTANNPDTMAQAIEVIRMLAFLEHSLVVELSVAIKAEVLAYAAIFGAIDAMWKEIPVADSLLGTYSNIVQFQNLQVPLPQQYVNLLNVVIDLTNNNNAARERILGIIETPNAALIEKEAAHGLSWAKMRETPFEYKGAMKVVGSNLPVNTKIHNLMTSVFSQKPIQGHRYIMTQDTKLAISQDEALMWAKVNPFSPMNDGTVINPF